MGFVQGEKYLEQIQVLPREGLCCMDLWVHGWVGRSVGGWVGG